MAGHNAEISQNHNVPPKSAELGGSVGASANNARPRPSSATPPAPHDPSPSVRETSAKPSRLESQPMTTTSSASSTLPSQARNAMEDHGPSPYGTRSRNRTGNARPNYAEDRELDMEYEWAPTSNKARGSSTSACSTNVQGEANESAGVSTRRRSLTTAVLPSAARCGNASVPKDPLPGMSSFSVHPEPDAASQPPSKKRKVASTSASSNLPPTTSAASRKALTAASVNGHRATNMLSFETSQGYLKNGELRADDGTVLAINGTYQPSLFRWTSPAFNTVLVPGDLLLITVRSRVPGLRASWRALLLGQNHGVSSRKERPQLTGRLASSELVLSSTGHTTQGQRYKGRFRLNAFRHLPAYLTPG